MPQSLYIETRDPGLYEFTGQLGEIFRKMQAKNGILTLFCRHTSASLLIQENADPTVKDDLMTFFERIAPFDGDYRHSFEGPDDMPAHIKSALTPVNLSIPVSDGRLMLGTWQGVYLFEHRLGSHQREVVASFIPEG